MIAIASLPRLNALPNFIRTAFTVVLASTLGIATVQAADSKTVAITQIVEHPALDSARQGVLDVLHEHGYQEGQNMKSIYENAQGNPTTAAQIAKKFAGERPDVIVAIATPSAQTAVAAARKTPVVFAAVTDPVGAKLVKNLDKPGGYVTGTTDMLPIAKHLQLIKQLIPNAKKVGTIYNPGEANSVTLINLLKQEGPGQGLEIVTAAANKSAEVLGAARALVGKVDVLYLPTDNTVISAAEAVIRVGDQNKLPVIAADTDTVRRGAVAAMGFNYYDVGRQAGEMVVRILGGEKPGDIAVEGVEKLELYLNLDAAKKMGVTIPEELQTSAKVLIGG